MHSDHRRVINYLHAFLGGSLVLIGLAKILSWILGHRILDAIDPILGLEYRYIYPPVAAVEICIGLSVLRVHQVSITSRALLLTWLGVCFACYRTAAHMIGYQGPCPCLGSIFDLWPLVAKKQDKLLMGLVVLLCSQILLLVRPIGRKRIDSQVPSLNI